MKDAAATGCAMKAVCEPAIVWVVAPIRSAMNRSASGGIALSCSPLLTGSLEGARLEMEVNYLAPWAVSRVFAPVLAANGGGVLVNMLSAASWRTNVRTPGYAASKAAEWSLTNALRLGLREQGTQVLAVHVATWTPTRPSASTFPR